jgi:hypothetical protein
MCVDTNRVAVQRPPWPRTFGRLAFSRATKRRERTCPRGMARSTSCTGSMDTSWQVCGVLTVPGAWGVGKYTVGFAVFPNGELSSSRSFTHSHYMHCCNLNCCDVTVSIVDILPGRFVSAYSFYNPDYRHMEWGRYTALREIFWTQQVCWPVHACRLLPSDALYTRWLHGLWS